MAYIWVFIVPELLTMYRRRYLLIHSTLQHQEQKHTDRTSNGISMPTFKTYKVSSYKSHFYWRHFFLKEQLHWWIIPNKELTPVVLKVFQTIYMEGTTPNSFYEARITLITKSSRNFTRKENYRTTSLMNIDEKILNKILPNQI